jgi:hypothetical protein
LVLAAAAANYNSVSTTSRTIGTGALSFTVDTGELYVVGTMVLIASTASPTNWMIAQVTAYDPVTGALTVNSLATNGSGTFASWTISLTGPKGADAVGWTTIGTVLTTSGASADFLNIPQTYNDLNLVINNVSHNSGSATGLSLGISADGTTFASSTGVSLISITAAQSWYGGIYIPGYREGSGILETAQDALTTSPSVGGNNGFCRPWRCDAPGIRGLRLAIASGAFDLGSITLRAR